MKSKIERIRAWFLRSWDYCSGGVWSDNRKKWWVIVIKTLNLSVRSFLNGDVQSQACAMTYRMLLAIVPALALLLAIARGFGFQNYLEHELYTLFPAQQTAIAYAWKFVDSYLNQTTEGLFVGVGIVFLLYTLISLVWSAEDTFNAIWGVTEGRSLWRKITDYTALLLILPILMICASGITVLLSSTLDSLIKISFLTPVTSLILEASSWVLTWLFFTAVYALFPNTRVRFVNALVAGFFAGTGFLIVQWLFVSGQMYVARYNAIYGSFSFLPLLLIWMQLTWVITLSGAVVCYSSQNVFSFSFDEEVRNMAPSYRRKTTVAIAAVVTQRFIKGQPPVTNRELIETYDLPARLCSQATDTLTRTGIFTLAVLDARRNLFGYQLAIPPEQLTLGEVCSRIDKLGARGFIPLFGDHFPGVVAAFDKLNAADKEIADKILISDIDIKDIIPQKSKK